MTRDKKMNDALAALAMFGGKLMAGVIEVPLRGGDTASLAWNEAEQQWKVQRLGIARESVIIQYEGKTLSDALRHLPSYMEPSDPTNHGEALKLEPDL